MLPTFSTQDIWALFVIPVVVGVITFYVQKFLDRGAVSTFRRCDRWQLRKAVARQMPVFDHLADGTILIRNQSLTQSLVVQGFVAFFVLSMFAIAAYKIIDVPVYSLRGLGLILVELIALHSLRKFGDLRQMSVTVQAIYANPVQAYSKLSERVRKVLPGEFEHEMDMIRRIAMREQWQRDTRRAAAKKEWNEAELDLQDLVSRPPVEAHGLHYGRDY